MPDERPEGPETPVPPALSEREAGLLSRLQAELGDGIVEHANACGGLVVRVLPDAWRRTAEVAHDPSEITYFGSGICS